MSRLGKIESFPLWAVNVIRSLFATQNCYQKLFAIGRRLGIPSFTSNGKTLLSTSNDMSQTRFWTLAVQVVRATVNVERERSSRK